MRNCCTKSSLEADVSTVMRVSEAGGTGVLNWMLFSPYCLILHKEQKLLKAKHMTNPYGSVSEDFPPRVIRRVSGKSFRFLGCASDS